MPFATTSLRIGGETPEAEKGRFWKWLFVALALSVVISGVANHVLSFEHGRDMMGDEHASVTVPVQTMTDSYAFAHGNQRVSAGRAWTQVGFGAAMMGVLIAGRTLIISWPFHPIGLLLMNSWPLQAFWFSIFVGWAIKVVMLRYGGARAFKRARVFFVGLILGEMASAGLWMLVGLLSGGTVTYRLLPG